jgi:hypothetical protein
MNRRQAPSKLAAAAADDDAQIFATLPENHLTDPLHTVKPIDQFTLIEQGKFEN